MVLFDVVVIVEVFFFYCFGMCVWCGCFGVGDFGCIGWGGYFDVDFCDRWCDFLYLFLDDFCVCDFGVVGEYGGFD